ncbi:MAG: phosphoenolpyruvate synthase [Spirochaetes bacterium]|jgi:CheY-like chemotaxis protein|nr:phosphoenolpyruvate synthase [Spirochaetota bacterium]
MTLYTDYQRSFSGFHNLMRYRVREILLVSSLYDAFVLEEDRGLSEVIFNQYIDLNLRFVPRITRVSSAEEALQEMQTRTFDVVLTMARLSDMDPEEFGRRVKEMDPEKPVILLTTEVLSPDLLTRFRRARSIDKIFYWLGDSKILLAIIKYVEDYGNVASDVAGGVQVILLVEDNPKFYSMFLPMMYTEVMTQTQTLISESINDYQRLLRMRARPKILLAETYEEAMEIFEAYRQNVLGIISDIAFPRQGQMDGEAGYRLLGVTKTEVPDLPVLLQSDHLTDRDSVLSQNAHFLDKNSPNLMQDLRDFIMMNLGFGDFVFRRPDGTEIARAHNLQEFERLLREVPLESVEYHAHRNHISIWLRARTEFDLADELRPKKVSDFSDMEAMREYLADAVGDLLDRNRAGNITDLSSYTEGADNAFIRIGSGSLGGKARGIAFVNALLSRSGIPERYEGISIRTPMTFVVCTDAYEEFLTLNELQRFAIESQEDAEIGSAFAAAALPEDIELHLRKIVERVDMPLAVRSSSVLEDSQNLPFAGLYATYMLPNNHPDTEVRLRQLADAVKLVYASVFYQAPKEYVRNTYYRIEEEKMAVIVQELAGEQHGDIFYPVVSGVGQSHNFYPTEPIKPSDGLAHVALGLGKTIVDGENIYRFSPRFPKRPPPYSSTGEFLKMSQSHFYALDLSDSEVAVEPDEGFSLRRLDLQQAEEDGTLFYVASTFSRHDGRIRNTLAVDGPRVVTFANILKNRIVPLPEILGDIMELGKASFGTDVEIEFALNVRGTREDSTAQFYFLQIRPMVVGRETVEVSTAGVDADHILVASNQAMGNGLFEGIYDLVYVDPDRFDVGRSVEVAREVGQINRKLAAEGRRCILIGFGRWGTSDRWLGIPVDWGQISAAQVIVESDLGDFRVDPSQGSHFFHNLISLRLGYFHIRGGRSEEYIFWDWIRQLPVEEETHFVRHVRLDKPLSAKIDGRSSRGVVLKPDGEA